MTGLLVMKSVLERHDINTEQLDISLNGIKQFFDIATIIDSNDKLFWKRLRRYTICSVSSLLFQHIHLPPHQNNVTFIEINNLTATESTVATKHNNIHTKSNLERPIYTRGRSVIVDRGDNGRRGSYESGDTSGRGYSQYQSRPKTINWRESVKEMMPDLKTNIMQKVQLSISAKIKEIALTLTTQVKNAINEGLYQRPTTINQEEIETELEANLELVTQECQPTNEEITDMDLEVEPRKRKEH